MALNGRSAAARSRARAAAPSALAPGAEVHVAIRPEDIEVDGGRRRRGPEPATLPGVIDTLLFVGDRYEARVTLGGEHSIVLLLPRAPGVEGGPGISLAFPSER